MKKRLHILFLLMVFAWQSIMAQTFPVTLVPQTVPPAPIYFSSYADASSINSPIRLQIILNDLAIANREIRLKAFFEGNGIAFQSNDLVVGAPALFVEGGVPLTLTNAELAPYFTFQNISGISPTAYGQVIPEGSYQFCFEVFDALTGARISQRTCATTYIFQNEPPFLVTPGNRIDIDEQNPINLMFQWTPRHINVSNVQYELSIVEIWDTTLDPQAAFLASPPFFQATTTNTSYLYGPADPLFLPNKRYAWRIQAKALNGAEEIGLFKNNGFSEIFWFNYTAPCDIPENVRHEVKGAQQANILWDDFTTDVPQFTVRYREKGNNNEWFFSRTNGNWITLWDLRGETTYEYQVNKGCLISESEYSPIQSFSTPLEDDQAGLINCGISPDLDIENMEPLEQLLPGNVFIAGDFPVKATEVSGSNGRFTGKGYVTFPYFKSIKVAVNFTNIFINNENQLAEGTVVTIYDPTWGNILDIDEVIDVGEDILDVITGDDEIIIPQLDYDIDTDDISINDGQIIITKPDGTQETHDYDEGDTYTITDASGDKWTIDEDGNITQTGQGDDSTPLTAENTDGIRSGTHAGSLQDPYVDNITNDAVKVTFRTGDDTRFALDLQNNEYEKANYPKISATDGESYYPAHKATLLGEEDVFYADIEINDSKVHIDSIIIKTVKNTAITHQRLEGTNTYKITVSGSSSYNTEECVVTYKDTTDNKYKIAASFFIHHLVKQTEVPVQVVTVNGGGNIANLQEGLNNIFGLAGGRFKVRPEVINMTIEESAWDDNGNKIIDYDGSGLLSDYPQELKNIYKEFKRQNPYYESQQYFVLVLGDGFTVSKPLSGFMPKTRQWGFVFEKHLGSGLEKKDSALKVAAHELGHGVFTLKHPFGENPDNAGQASTWLMDYGNGTELGFPNWATMNDDGLDLFLFQEDSGGESVSTSMPSSLAINEKKYNCDSGDCKEDQNGKYYFGYLTPSGERIILSEEYKPIFFHGISSDTYNKVVPGTLIGFKKEEKKEDGTKTEVKYSANIMNEEFSGYSDFTYEKPGFSDDANKSFVIGLPYGNPDNDKADWKNYKFKGDGIPDFDNQNNAILDITSEDVQNLGFFKTKEPIHVIRFVNPKKIIGEGQIDITEMETRLLSGYYNTDISQFFEDIFNFSNRSRYKIAHNERREVLLIVKISEIHNRYPKIFREFTKFFDNWDLCNITDITFHYGKWDSENIPFSLPPSAKYKQWSDNLEVTQSNDQLYDFYQDFLIELLDFVNTGAATNIACLNSDFTTKSGEEIYECIRKASQFELEALSLDKQNLAIKKILLTSTNGGGITDEKEIEIARILEAISNGASSYYTDALNYLETEKVAYNWTIETREGPVSRSATHPLWYALFDNVEDEIFIFGNDNRQSIVKSIGKIFIGSENFANQLKNSIDPVKLKAAITFGDLNSLHDYFYTFENNYQNIFRRGWSDLAASATGPSGLALYDADDFYKSVDTEVLTNNNYLINAKQKVKWGLFSSKLEKEENLTPFQLVSFINISKNNLLKPFSAKDAQGNPQAIFIPAFTLHYASKTDALQTKSDIIQTAVDLLAFLPSGGTASLNTFGKFLYYTDKISSVTSIAGTAFRETNPELTTYMNQLSMVSGVVSLASLSTFVKSDVLKNKKLGELMHPDALDNLNDPVANINQFADNILNNPDNAYDITKLTPEQAEASKKILQKELRSLEGLPNFNAPKIRSAISKLDDISPQSLIIQQASVVDASIVDKETAKKALTAFNDKNKDGFIDIIIHGSDNKFILDLPNGLQELQTTSLINHLLTSSDLSGSTKFRLLSCSTMDLAEDLVRQLPEGYKVRATDDIVRIHTDGGISTVPRGADNPANQWEDLTKNTDGTVNRIVSESPALTTAEHLTDFVELGRRTKAEQFLSTLKSGAFPEIWSRLDELDLSEANLLEFASDFKNASADELARLSANNAALVGSWKSIQKFSSARANIDNLENIAKTSKRFRFNNKTGFDGLEELFKATNSSSIDHVLMGLKKAEEVFDASIPITISAQKSGAQYFITAIDEAGNQVCRFVGDKVSKIQLVPDGKTIGSYKGVDITQNGTRVGFRQQLDWTTNGTTYKDAAFVSSEPIGRGSYKTIYEIAGNKVIAILDEGALVSVLNKEIDALEQLAGKQIPTVTIIEKTTHKGRAAFVMEKYAQGSEEIAVMVNGQVTIKRESSLLNQKSIDDLNAIKKGLEDQQIEVDDLQFLIKEDGSVVVADPGGINLNTPPTKNVKLIDALIDQAKKVGHEATALVFRSFSKPIRYGNDIIKTPGKKLNILGRVNAGDGSIGTKKLFDELIEKGVPEEELTGLFVRMPIEWKNLPVLGDEGQQMKYWKEFNEPYVDEVIKNGGDIRFIHDPRLPANRWNNVDDIKDVAFRNKCKSEGIRRLRTFMSMEYDYLVRKGYKLLDNGLMIKP